jgi:penicillin-binding protein 2
MIGRDEKVSQLRLTAVQYIVLAIFMILAYGLWRLQVVQSDLYASLAEKNRVRNVPILAPRGKILDREGRTIVENYPSFTSIRKKSGTASGTSPRCRNTSPFF